MARFPWPFRRSADRVDPTPGPEAARPAETQTATTEPPTPAPAPVEPHAVDAGFAAGFRSRADRTTGTGLLGPWGGLGSTARFVVEASRLPATLATQRRVDRLGASPGMMESPADFARDLPSLASLADPFGASGDSEGVFADSLPVVSGADTLREGRRPEAPIRQGVRRAPFATPQRAIPQSSVQPRPAPVVARRAAPERTVASTARLAPPPGRAPDAAQGVESSQHGRAATESTAAPPALVLEPGDAGGPIADSDSPGSGERVTQRATADELVQSRVDASMAMPLIAARKVDPASEATSPVARATSSATVRARVVEGGTSAPNATGPGDAAPPSPEPPNAATPTDLAALATGEAPVAQSATVAGETTPGGDTPAADPSARAPELELPVARLIAKPGEGAPIAADSPSDTPSTGSPAASSPPGTPRTGAPRRFTVGEPIESPGPFATGTTGSTRDAASSRSEIPRGLESRPTVAARREMSRDVSPPGGTSPGTGMPLGSGSDGGVPLVVGRAIDTSTPGLATDLLLAEPGTEPIDSPADAGTDISAPGFALNDDGQAMPLATPPTSETGAPGSRDVASATGSAVARAFDATPASAGNGDVTQTKRAGQRTDVPGRIGTGTTNAGPLFADWTTEPIREGEALPAVPAEQFPVARRLIDNTGTSSADFSVGTGAAGPLPPVARTVDRPSTGPAPALPLAISGSGNAGFDGTPGVPGDPFGATTAFPGGERQPGAFGAISASPVTVARRVDTRSAGYVSRAEEDGGEASGASAQTTLETEDDGPAKEADIESLTEKVWQRIRSRLLLERERRRGLP